MDSGTEYFFGKDFKRQCPVIINFERNPSKCINVKSRKTWAVVLL